MTDHPRRRFALPAALSAVRGRRVRRAARRFPLLPRRERFGRGIYLVPSLFTLGNLFCGFYAVVLSIEGHQHTAAMWLCLAVFFDSLDGKVARWTHTTSDFGVQLDSLCDVISFGVAPAILMYTWTLRGTGRAGWLVAFIYVVSGASRLARFNVQTLVLDSQDFVGLPTPAGAGLLASIVFSLATPPATPVWPFVVMGIMVLVALMQVSTVRYPSFKRFETTKGRQRTLVGMAAFMALVAYHPPTGLLAIGVIYLLSGPINRVFFRRKFIGLVADVSPKAVPLVDPLAAAAPGPSEAAAGRSGP